MPELTLQYQLVFRYLCTVHTYIFQVSIIGIGTCESLRIDGKQVVTLRQQQFFSGMVQQARVSKEVVHVPASIATCESIAPGTRIRQDRYQSVMRPLVRFQLRAFFSSLSKQMINRKKNIMMMMENRRISWKTGGCYVAPVVFSEMQLARVKCVVLLVLVQAMRPLHWYSFSWLRGRPGAPAFLLLEQV